MPVELQVRAVEQLIEKTDDPALFREILGLDTIIEPEYSGRDLSAYPHSQMKMPSKFDYMFGE